MTESSQARGEGGHTAVFGRGKVKSVYATLRPAAGEDGASFARRLVDLLNKNNASFVKCDVFGSCGAYNGFMRELETAVPPHGLPVTWVEGAGCGGHPIAGAAVRCVTGVEAETIFLNTRPVGRLYEDDFARFCLLGGIHSNAPTVMPGQQTQMTLEALEAALNAAGMDMTNIARTWFYNNCLLEWYDSFNAARTRFYRERGIFDRMLPASTGIGGKNPHESALVAGAEAVVFKHAKASMEAVASPLQNQAFSYGSAFSRAVELKTPAERRLLVSGTASINEAGKTVFEGDLHGQIKQTLDVVEALLRSRQMGWTDVVRAIAYVKQPGFAKDFSKYCASSGLPALPWIIAHNEVCRDNLLFEIEVDAVTAAAG
ncbi:MAG TPA: Rid family hydrolase [Chitinivibrionales bacterium]|nr:Rid family hydrolase [Chitinivibrionales bacterium]